MNGSHLVIFPICYSWNWNGFKKVPKKRKSEARAGKRTLKFQLPCKPQTSLCLSSLIATSLVGFSENTLHDYKINFQGVILAEQMLQLSPFLYSFHSLNQSSRGKKYWKEVLNSFFTQGKKEFSGRVFEVNCITHSCIRRSWRSRMIACFASLKHFKNWE